MKTLTIKCDDRMLQMARDRAQLEHATLECKLREWLEEYTKEAEIPEEAEPDGQRRNFVDVSPEKAKELLKHYPTPDGRFTRGELAVATARRLRANRPTDHLGNKKLTRRDMNEC